MCFRTSSLINDKLKIDQAHSPALCTRTSFLSPKFFSFLILSAWLLGGVAFADTSLTIKNSFIEKYKNKATIDTDYVIHFAHSKPKTPSASKPANDGDIHIAGTSEDIQLPIVAEIMNAATQPKALKFVNQMKGTNKPVHLIGVWRIWPEHGGESVQVMGESFTIEDTNPDHVFEIHPLTQIEDNSLVSSFKPIPNYKPKDASDAFHHYEGGRSTITPGDNTTKIVMSMVTYNYVKFRLKLLEDPTHKLEDGLTVFATVNDVQGEKLVDKRRIVFVNDTQPEAAVRKLKKGQCMLVLGMPRLDLALVSWRIEHSKTDPDVLRWGLPYEIVIVGDYKDNRCEED